MFTKSILIKIFKEPDSFHILIVGFILGLIVMLILSSIVGLF